MNSLFSLLAHDDTCFRDVYPQALGVLALAIVMIGIAAVVFTQCVGIYARLLASLRDGRGKVWAEPLGLPDLMVSAVLISWLGASAVHGFLRNAPAPSLGDSTLLESALLYGLVVCALALFLQARRISLTRLFGFRLLKPGAVLLRGVRFFLAALPLVLFCFWLVHFVMGEDAEPQELVKYFTKAARQSDWRRVLLAAGMASLVAPVEEEFLFRGYFYGVLRRHVGAVPAMLFTAALFAAIHMNGPAFFPLFVLAICFTLAYEATGSLLVPMLMHALFNSVMLAAMLYSAHHL